MTEAHDENNHLKGTLYDCEPQTPDSPVMRGVVTIDGVKMRVAVFPLKLSRSGRLVYPVRLEYFGDGATLRRHDRLLDEEGRADW